MGQAQRELFKRPSRGSAMYEVVVAAFLLTTVIGAAGAALAANRRLQRVQRQKYIAQCELSNQLEALSVVSQEAYQSESKQLVVSQWASKQLSEARLVPETFDDEHGQRVLLTLHWQGVAPMRVSGVAWFELDGRSADPKKLVEVEAVDDSDQPGRQR